MIIRESSSPPPWKRSELAGEGLEPGRTGGFAVVCTPLSPIRRGKVRYGRTRLSDR